MKTRKYLLLFAMIFTACVFVGCSDDEEDISRNDIVGTWYATVIGGKATISLTFESDKTGSLHYCWDNVRYHTVGYAFPYSISGNKLKNKGTKVDNDPENGVSTYESSMDFTYSDGKLKGGDWSTDNGYTKIK